MTAAMLPASIDSSDVTDLLTGHGSTLLWAVVKGIAIWGSVGLVLGVALYLIVARLGWLDVRGRKRRVARVMFALALLLGFVPLVAGAGVVHELGNGTARVARDEMRRTRGLSLCGQVLLAPAVVAHLVAEGKRDAAVDTASSWSAIEAADVAFLVDASARDKALAVLTHELLRAALEAVPGYAETRREPIQGFVLAIAERRLAGAVGEHIEDYTRLFDGIRPGADGTLAFADAADAVGTAFFTSKVEPVIRAPYDSMRMQFLGFALLLVALGIGLIQALGRWLTRERPAQSAGKRPS